MKEFEKYNKEKLEAYNTGLRGQRDKLEDLWMSVNDELKTSHDTAVIEEYKNVLVKVASSQSIQYEDKQPSFIKTTLSTNLSLSGKTSFLSTFCHYANWKVMLMRQHAFSRAPLSDMALL